MLKRLPFLCHFSVISFHARLNTNIRGAYQSTSTPKDSTHLNKTNSIVNKMRNRKGPNSNSSNHHPSFIDVNGLSTHPPIQPKQETKRTLVAKGNASPVSFDQIEGLPRNDDPNIKCN